jgi:hypothetical protein
LLAGSETLTFRITIKIKIMIMTTAGRASGSAAPP